MNLTVNLIMRNLIINKSNNLIIKKFDSKSKNSFEKSDNEFKNPFEKSDSN